MECGYWINWTLKQQDIHKMGSHYLGIIFIVTIQVTASTAADCTTANKDACWDLMYPLPSYLGWDTIVPTLSEGNMTEHCRLFDSVEACLTNLDCAILDDKAHEGLIDAYKWLCDEAFGEYLKHRTCFTNTRLHEEGEFCNSSLTNRLDNLDNSQTTQYRFQRICQYANDYLDCVENAVQSFCGKEAADWQREYDRRSIQPLLRVAACQLDGDGKYYYPVAPEDKTKTYIIIGCIVAMAVILILIIFVVVVMYRNKRKSDQRRSREERAMAHYSAEGGIVTASQFGPSVQAGPLPPKEPPPYDGDAPPPEYTPNDPTQNQANGYAVSMQPPMNGSYQDIKKAPPSVNGSKRGPGSDAGSVYSGRTSRSHVSGFSDPIYRSSPGDRGSTHSGHTSRGVVNAGYDDVHSTSRSTRGSKARQPDNYF